MPGGDFVAIILGLIALLAAASETLVWMMPKSPDPHAAAHGDVPRQPDDELAALRKAGL